MLFKKKNKAVKEEKTAEVKNVEAEEELSTETEEELSIVGGKTENDKANAKEYEANTEEEEVKTGLKDEAKAVDEADSTEEHNKMALYILCDKDTMKFRQSVEGSELNVTKIIGSIADARDELLLEADPYRMVIVDTGTGKFTSIQARKELTDMIGIMDEDSEVSVFYTDEALQSDVKDILGHARYKCIKWYRYDSTTDVILKVLSEKEEYTGRANENFSVNADEIRGSQGLSMTVQKENEKFKYRRELYSVDEIKDSMNVYDDTNTEEDSTNIISYKEVI